MNVPLFVLIPLCTLAGIGLLGCAGMLFIILAFIGFLRQEKRAERDKDNMEKWYAEINTSLAQVRKES